MNDFHPGYYGQTVLDPLGVIALLVLGVAMLTVPRRYALLPLIILGCFVSQGQRFVILTLNFDLGRAMLIFGAVRILIYGEWKGFVWRGMDSLVLAMALASTAVIFAQYGTIDALKYQSGSVYDILGSYFLCRCLIRDLGDVHRLAVAFAIISVPVSLAFLVERLTHRNMFSIFGGVPAETAVREGRLRCQGAYTHPIIAGCYWASVLPLIAALWWQRGSPRNWAMIGVVCSLTIIYLCSSSTPFSAVAFGLVGGGFFFLRRRMRLIRWGILGTLVVLQLVKKAPVWHLITRANLVGGSTGNDRYILIDAFIRHFADWWLLGSREVISWGVTLGDITNQYVLEGVRGGIWTLALFVMLIVTAFAYVGRLWRQNEKNLANLAMSWALGVSLFVHTMSFLGVSYFGQVSTLWFLTLAMIGSTAPIPRRAAVAARKPASRKPTLAAVRRPGKVLDTQRPGRWVNAVR